MSGALQAVFQNQRSFGAAPGQQAFTTAGTYTWVAPTISTACVVCVGGGGGGGSSGSGSGGGGGAGGASLRYVNDIAITAGASYTVVVGARGTAGVFNVGSSEGGYGGSSYFSTTSTVLAKGGGGGGRGSGDQ